MSPNKPTSYYRCMPKKNNLDELQDMEFKRNTKLYQEFKELKNQRNEHFIELQEDNKPVTDIQEN